MLGVPNIRIQVNNENLQNPPYLLEAIKQVEASEKTPEVNGSTQPMQQPQFKPKEPTSPGQRSEPSSIQRIEPKTTESDIPRDDNEPHNFSVVKEETIEEILDLDPESVLRLSPESVMNGVSPSEYTRISDHVASESSNKQELPDLENNDNKKMASDLVVKKHDNVNSRRPQLPVANSHLKKPASQLEDEDSPENDEANGMNRTAFQKTGGAKTLVSPSVASDDNLSPNEQSKKAAAYPPPDTWSPHQIMQGVTNVSHVPATVNREYGSQTRTRITLGGGYIRDKLPPLVNPSSNEYVDNRPEKPVTPLEKPDSSQQSGSKVISSVVEVPEKIILPASVAKPVKEQPFLKLTEENGSASVFMKAKLDNRCPKRGVMTFDHPTACDKYFYCEDGFISEQTCPNGLMYGTRDMVKDYCVHRWKVNCEDKSVPNPISSPGCRWQYGIFNVQGSPKCSPDFYECMGGTFEVKRCSIDGQIYDDRTKSCQFAETVGCANEALADFHCPPDDQGNTYWPFPRYFLNERALIHCVNDKPEIVRCTDEERVDPEHLHCVPLSKLNASNVNAEQTERKSRERKKNT